MSNAELLGVPAGASREAIKKAYRAKAKLCHPDLYPGKADEFRRLTAAYQALLNGGGVNVRRMRTDAPHNPFDEFDRHARR